MNTNQNQDQAQEQQQREKQLQNESKKTPKVNNLGKMYSEEDAEFYVDLVRRANKQYQNDYAAQAEFIHFYATSKYGRHFQIFIYNYIQGRAGHHFYINSAELIQIKFNNCMYYIWRVHLIEDKK